MTKTDAMQLEVTITRANGPPASATITGNYKQLSAQMQRLFYRQVIAEALVEALGNRKKAAKLLGISYRSLFYAMKNCGFPMRALAILTSSAIRQQDNFYKPDKYRLRGTAAESRPRPCARSAFFGNAHSLTFCSPYA